MTKRAAKGGELGANGEWYEGGKFINTIPENKKREGSTPRKARKVEIEPYVWVLDPMDGTHSIYRKLAGIHGKVINGVMVINTTEAVLRWTGDTIEQVQSLAARYNAGERWM